MAAVSPHSPAARAGLLPGQQIVSLNGWKVEAVDRPDTLQSLLLAGGFFITVGWLRQVDTQEGDAAWLSLGTF